MEHHTCFSPADILLPKGGFERWSVIACDQYTSEPDYWAKVEQTVGSAPSALRLILPEVKLGQDDARRIEAVNATMREYLAGDVFEAYPDSLVFVERRQSDGLIRRGLIGKIDLACYDYRQGAAAAVRATEKTVLERIPPRVKIRQNAPLELPHVMLLIDDPDGTVIEPLGRKTAELTPLYDFELMQRGGHIRGWRVPDTAAPQIEAALLRLQSAADGLLFCVGDGNHSLAAAKACYERSGAEADRYALVEVVNIHDPALQFEPIYRVLFGVDPEQVLAAFLAERGGEYTGPDAQRFTCIAADVERVISVRPSSKLSVGTLQTFLDGYIAQHSGVTVDYIHGEESLKRLCREERTLGFLFDGMRKDELFPAVREDGSLPRKTFSMGHADDKRFYLEAREIR